VSESTTSQILISAQPAEVAAVIADVMAYPEWTDGMSDVVVDVTNPDNSVAQATFSIQGGPISDRVTLTYAWSSDSVSWHLIHGSSLKALDGTYAWQAVEGGTMVSYSLAVDLSMSLPGIIKRAAEKQIISMALQGLKKRVESR
jgi:ribosome-associated toxin RatA of RatAB toxin-antitoxin module